MNTSKLLLKSNFPYMVPPVPIPSKAMWLKACAVQFFHCLWKYPPAFTTRLHKSIQPFNSFLGTSILWTLSNQLLKAPDLCSQPWEASCPLLKWRLWCGRGEAEPSPTAHKQQLLFPPTLPRAPVCAPSSMDITELHRAPLPHRLSHYQETTQTERRKTSLSKPSQQSFSDETRSPVTAQLNG